MNKIVYSRRAAGALMLGAVASAASAQSLFGLKKAVAAPAPTQAAPWPTRPVRLVCGFPPGSVMDTAARCIADPLSKMLGQPVIVELKPGAGGTIAADYVAKSTDNHTLGIMNNTQLTTAKLLNPAVKYDPEKDLAPIALLATTPLVLVLHPSAQGRTIQERMSWLRNLGDRANFGSPGTGTVGHLGFELLKARTGVLATHVPFQGNPQIVNAILGDQIQAALLPPGMAVQQVKAGKMIAVGLTAEKRSPLAPDVPTLREVGVLGADAELWAALAGPATLPTYVQDRLGAAIVEIVNTAETEQRMLTAGWQPSATPANGLRMLMSHDMKTFGGIIMMRGIKVTS